MVPSHHSIVVTPWYTGILLWYGSFSHIRHILPRIAPYVPTALHKARYGPTALALCTIISLHFPLCYNGTLVWLSLTNTPHACHFSVVYRPNVRIGAVFIHLFLAFSHNKFCPLIHCSLSVYCISQRLVHPYRVSRPILHAIFINPPIRLSSLTCLLPLNRAPCRSHGSLLILQRCAPLFVHLVVSPPPVCNRRSSV